MNTEKQFILCNESEAHDDNNEYRSPLNQIYFYLTEGCNLACRHCWLSAPYEKDNMRYPVLELSFFKKAIFDAMPLGLHSIKLTGGEPLLHPQFKQLLEITCAEELQLTLETNGLLCTASLAREIAKAKNPFVSISIDGANAESHDRLRGVKGAFEKAKNGMKHLTDAGIKTQAIMTVTRFNRDQIEDLIPLVAAWGASSLKFNIVQPTARGKEFGKSNEALTIAEYIALGQYIDLTLASQCSLQLYFDYPLAFRPFSRLSNHGDSTCGILGILGVIPSGHYALCGIGRHIPDMVFGEIKEDDLKTVWHENKILQSLRSGLPIQLTGICSLCLMRSRCLGSCIAQNYYRSGSLWAPFWFCEQAHQEGLFPKGRLR